MPDYCESYLKSLQRYLRKYGLEVYDKTQNVSYASREHEIRLYIKKNKIKNFIILDDEKSHYAPDTEELYLVDPKGQKFFCLKQRANMNVTVNLDYKNYIFDLYGTLIDIHTEEGERKLWKALAKYYRQYGAFYFACVLKKKYLKYVAEELKKSEEIQVEIVFRKLFADKGVEADDALIAKTCRFFRDTSTYHLRLYEWSLPILEKLKSNGKKVYLLSNAQRSFTYHEMEKLDIVKYFDKIYISSDHGVKKPNPKFFQILMEAEGLDAKDCLFLGNDQTCDVLGAQGVGMDTWYVHTNCSPEYKTNIKANYEFLG